jgi:hypothetical protein
MELLSSRSLREALRGAVPALLIVASGILVLLSEAQAGANPAVKAAVHVLPHSTRSCISNYPVITGCGDIITTEPGASVDAFPIFFDLVEYQGLDYGLTWPGLYSCVFTSCSDLTLGGIVFPTDAISQAWVVCQAGPAAVPGWAWIYDYGLVCVIPHAESGTINIGDCSAGLDHPVGTFCAGIGGYLGDDPCLPVTRTWTVCPDGSGDFTTIQAAIDAAGNDDVIVLCDDVYSGPNNHDLDYKGKAITIRSGSGNPEDCVIDCEWSDGQPHRGFYFHSGEGSGSVLESVTIMNGWAALDVNGLGGAVCCESSSPTFVNCIFLDNSNSGTVPGNYGVGGMFCHDSSPSLTNCSFIDNSGYVVGAFESIGSSYPTFTGCIFVGNSGNYGIGGLNCGSVDLTDCTIWGNFSNWTCAVSCGAATIRGCTISNNWADGIHCSGPLTLERTILWGNCSGSELSLSPPGTAVISCCCVNSSGVGPAGSITWGAYNIFVDPLFCESAACDYWPMGGCYLLEECSPCLNASGCGLIGANGAGCPCGGGPSAGKSTSWSSIKARFR